MENRWRLMCLLSGRNGYISVAAPFRQANWPKWGKLGPTLPWRKHTRSQAVVNCIAAIKSVDDLDRVKIVKVTGFVASCRFP